MVKGLDNFSCDEKLRELFSLQKRQLRGHLINVHRYLKRDAKKMEQAFLGASNRRRASGQKLILRKLHLNMRSVE